MSAFDDWREQVVEQVRFRPDRKAIARELTAHFQDHVRDLERLDYPWQLAEQRALAAMGDAEAVGKALDRVHKPWLGWLWVASRCILLLTLVMALILGLEPAGQWLRRAKIRCFPRRTLGDMRRSLPTVGPPTRRRAGRSMRWKAS